MTTKLVISKETPYQDACRLLGQSELKLDNFSFLPENQREYMHSMHRVVTVIEAQKQARQFDWNDDDQYKYYPWWDMETYGDAEPGSGFSYYGYVNSYAFTYVGARLSNFSAEETKFIAEAMFEDYRIIMKNQ
jgi:hypothetical protein